MYSSAFLPYSPGYSVHRTCTKDRPVQKHYCPVPTLSCPKRVSKINYWRSVSPWNQFVQYCSVHINLRFLSQWPFTHCTRQNQRTSWVWCEFQYFYFNQLPDFKCVPLPKLIFATQYICVVTLFVYFSMQNHTKI